MTLTKVDNCEVLMGSKLVSGNTRNLLKNEINFTKTHDHLHYSGS